MCHQPHCSHRFVVLQLVLLLLLTIVIVTRRAHVLDYRRKPTYFVMRRNQSATSMPQYHALPKQAKQYKSS